MTGRDHLDRRKRWLAAGVVASVVLLVLGIVLHRTFGEGVTQLVIVPGMVAFVAVVVAQGFALRCPWCRANLSMVLSYVGWWRLDPKVRYCPYCGAEFDAVVGTAGEWNDPEE